MSFLPLLFLDFRGETYDKLSIVGPITTIKTAEWVDLTHTFDPDIPRFSEFEKAKYPHYLQSKNMAFMYNVGISLHNTAHTLTHQYIL